MRSFDEFNINRADIFNQAPEIIKYHKSKNINATDNQKDMFDDISTSTYRLLQGQEWKPSYKLMKEYEMLGFYLSGHPLEEYKSKYKPLLLKEYSEN